MKCLPLLTLDSFSNLNKPPKKERKIETADSIAISRVFLRETFSGISAILSTLNPFLQSFPLYVLTGVDVEVKLLISERTTKFQMDSDIEKFKIDGFERIVEQATLVKKKKPDNNFKRPILLKISYIVASILIIGN